MDNTTKTETQYMVPSRPPVAILGVQFDNVTAPEALNAIEQMVASGRPHYLVTANVDFLVQAQDDLELRRILIDAHLVLCDGTPVLWASRLLGNPLPERVAGSDLAPMLLKVAAEKQYRVFFLGATPDSVEEAVSRLKMQHPTLPLVGYYSPPFKGLLEMDHEEISRRVREARPDLLFVAFGCPKAEKWMAMHYRELGVPVVAGVGATIDFLAGRVKRAPHWMRGAGMEWLFRLGCEPRRLFRRYMRDLWGFSWRIMAQWWLLQILPRLRSRNSAMAPRQWLENVQCVGRHCIADLSGLQYIDSTDTGFLLAMRQKFRAADCQFVLASVSRGVRRALALMKLDEHFPIAEDVTAAKRVILGRTLEESVTLTTPELEWLGEITAENAGAVWTHTQDLLASIERPSPIAIDLSHARFIDSSGLTIMVRSQKWAALHGARLFFKGAQPAVRAVVHMARLDQLLVFSGS